MARSLGQFHQKGGPDVPVLDGGTGASVDSTARTNLGITIFDETTHDALDHAGVPGVGDIGITVLDATATETEINAAFTDANVGIVLLLRGVYTISGLITIPDGKSLLGAGGPAESDGSVASNGVRLDFGASGAITMNDHSRLAYLGIQLTASTGADIIQAGTNPVVIEHLGIQYNSFNAANAIDISGFSGSAIRNVNIDASGQTSAVPLIDISGAIDDRAIIENCRLRDGNDDGISVTGAISVFNCQVTGCSGIGINVVSPSRHGTIRDCYTASNGSHGIFMGTLSTSAVGGVFNCFSENNTGDGFNLLGTGATGIGDIAFCKHSGNTGAGITAAAGWVQTANHAV